MGISVRCYVRSMAARFIIFFFPNLFTIASGTLGFTIVAGLGVGALGDVTWWVLVQAAIAGRASLLGRSLRRVRKGSGVTGNAAHGRVTAGWRGRQGQGSRCQGPRHGVIVTVTESFL